jgi:hypothetical protein
MLLGMICGKVLAMALKWGDMLKVSNYLYSQECYGESFCIIDIWPAHPLVMPVLSTSE